MADSTLRGAFELSAEQSIRQLHSIRDAGGEADASLERLGRRMDSLPRRAEVGWGGMVRVVDRNAGRISRRIDELDAKLDAFGRKSPTANVSLSGFDRANAQLSELEARLDRLDRRRASAHVGIGGGFGNMAGGGGGGGGAQDARLLSSLGGMGGALPWWAALLPLAPTLLGGAGALVGSAGSAALGAGTLGVGAAGALGAGGIASTVVARSAITQLQGLTKAQTSYNTAVKEYGQASTQAATAKLKLDQALATSPAGAAGAARQTSLLASAFRSATAPAYSSVYSAVGQGAYSIRQALPQIAPLVNSATGVTARSGAQFTRFLTDPASIRSYQALIAGFVQDLPMVEGSLQNVTRTFLNLSVAAQPFFRDALVWVQGWTGGLARSSGDTAKVSADMQRMVTSAKDWGRFLGAGARTLRDLFAPGTTAGNSMVTDLTAQLNTWDRWLRANPQKVRGFYSDAVQGTERIASIIGRLTGDVWQLFRALEPIFKRAEQFMQFASSIGGGNLAVGTALLYGGYRGVRGALGGRGPGFGSALSTFVLGPSGFRGGGRAGGGTSAELAAGEAAAVERRAMIAERSAMLHSRLGEGAIADRLYSSGALDVAARAARPVGGLLGGAARFALPVLGISALLGAMRPTTGGLSGHVQNAVSSLTLGLVPGYVSPQTRGVQAAQRLLASVPPGVDTFGAVSRQVRSLESTAAQPPASLGQLAAGQLAGSTLATQRTSTITALAQAQMSDLARRAGQVTTPQGAQTVARQVAQVRLELSPGEASRFSHYLAQITQTAANNAGIAASNGWAQAFQLGIEHGHPERAVNTMLSGMTSQLRGLGPQGRRAFASSTAQWVHQLELANPQMRAPLDRLMNGIVDRMNRLSGSIGNTWQDIQRKTYYFNGQIFKGVDAAWNGPQGVWHALTNGSAVAQEHLSGIWGQIQSQALHVLTMMGFSPAQARNVLAATAKGGISRAAAGQEVGQQAGTAAPLTVGPQVRSAGRIFARGGVLGGSGLLDSVELPNGAVAAPGEAWIANRHTMKDLDLAARAMYGKPAWEMIRDEDRPHSWPLRGATTGRRRAAFGISGGFGTSGNVVLDSGVNMSMGQEPQILSDLRRLSHELHNTVYVISGYRSPAHSVAVGGFADDPHTRGQAADIGIGSPSRSSMFGVSEAQLRAVGLYRPFYPASAAEVNHVQLLAGGASGAPIGALGATGSRLAAAHVNLRAPRLGLPGVPGVMADQSAAGMTLGLQTRINQQLGALGARSGGSTAGLSGSLVTMVRQLSSRYGWAGQIGDWLNVINRESGGSMTATNPSSGAYGIAQFIQGASGYYNYGGNPNTQAGQLLAMANYIHGRYGNPAGAWAHEQSAGWYQRGGRVSWGGWNDKGGDFVTHGPTVFGAGERRKERVTISPVHSTPTAGRGIVLNFNGPVHFGGSKAELDKAAQYVAGKILDALDGASDGTDSDLIGAPR